MYTKEMNSLVLAFWLIIGLYNVEGTGHAVTDHARNGVASDGLTNTTDSIQAFLSLGKC